MSCEYFEKWLDEIADLFDDNEAEMVNRVCAFDMDQLRSMYINELTAHQAYQEIIQGAYAQALINR